MTKWLFLLGSVLLIGLGDQGKRTPAAKIFVADTIPALIYPVFDGNGILEQYKASIFTPVCEVERCYAIEIDLYWDLIGRFVAYDTLPGEGLTKLDHIPFTGSDYVQLTEILSDQNSILALYTKEELVKNTRESDLDGMTGATIQEVKELVIDGAVYSCYTLWHIAHGSVRDSLQQATLKMIDGVLVNKLVDQEDLELNYFLIEQFSAEDYTNYLPLLLRTFDNAVGYYAKNAIERMPAQVLKEEVAQEYFENKFSYLNYFAQVALLEKLDSISVEEEFKNVLAQHLDDRDSYKNELIRSILND